MHPKNLSHWQNRRSLEAHSGDYKAPAEQNVFETLFERADLY